MPSRPDSGSMTRPLATTRSYEGGGACLNEHAAAVTTPAMSTTAERFMPTEINTTIERSCHRMNYVAKGGIAALMIASPDARHFHRMSTQHGTDRILTTHVGSLPRPHDLLDLM